MSTNRNRDLQQLIDELNRLDNSNTLKATKEKGKTLATLIVDEDNLYNSVVILNDHYFRCDNTADRCVLMKLVKALDISKARVKELQESIAVSSLLQLNFLIDGLILRECTKREVERDIDEVKTDELNTKYRIIDNIEDYKKYKRVAKEYTIKAWELNRTFAETDEEDAFPLENEDIIKLIWQGMFIWFIENKFNEHI